jgi:aspartyl-tRNA(Asn)/glutamyl-tRNA(Gln) amidotransferase subunit C
MAEQLDVAYVARLARLNLTTDETELFGKQLGDILELAEKLKTVDVSDVEPATHAVPLFNVLRDDEARDSLPAQEALQNAPWQANGLFIVTKVVE